MAKEFLKMENRLVMELEIKPLSPIVIKLGDGNEENKSEKSESVISFMTSDTPRGNLIKYNKNKKIEDNRKGEPFILGSTLRGLFRERFNKIYDYKKDNDDTETFKLKEENKNHKEVDKLFGWIEGEKAQKGRIFIGDAYLEKQELRENFYTKSIDDALEEIKIIRNITPIDGFTGKAIVPLNYECTLEKFETELIVNNITLEEMKNIFLVIRDSYLEEIRIGNSKTRGFGQIKFNIKNLVVENYRNKSQFIMNLKKYFEKNITNSIKIGDNFLRENLELKEEYKDIELGNPNEFIESLFREVE